MSISYTRACSSNPGTYKLKKENVNLFINNYYYYKK